LAKSPPPECPTATLRFDIRRFWRQDKIGSGGPSGGGGGAAVWEAGGGGSYIDASGTVITELSGVPDPLGDGNGEVIIQIMIPEPSTIGLVGLGLAAMLAIIRRRRA
jgi:hypothetical protein